MNIRQQDYWNTKPGINFEIEQLLIEKQKWIDNQLSNFSIFERTTDIIKLIHEQAAEMYDEQLESLHKLYSVLHKNTTSLVNITVEGKSVASLEATQEPSAQNVVRFVRT